MANPLLELKEILNKVTQRRKIGKVLQVNGRVLVISSGLDMVRIRNTTATVYKVGDTVSYQGDVLLGKAGSGLQPKVFKV